MGPQGINSSPQVVHLQCFRELRRERNVLLRSPPVELFLKHFLANALGAFDFEKKRLLGYCSKQPKDWSLTIARSEAISRGGDLNFRLSFCVSRPISVLSDGCQILLIPRRACYTSFLPCGQLMRLI